MAGVAAPRRDTLARLAALLRVADGLDRGRAGAVGGIETTMDITRVRLHVCSDDDVEIDLWGGRRKRELFERLFDRRLELVRG